MIVKKITFWPHTREEEITIPEDLQNGPHILPGTMNSLSLLMYVT